MEFNVRLKLFRKKANLTQLEIAKILNVTNTCYAAWEQGRNQPGIESLKKLAKIFNITVDELIGSEDYDYTFEYTHNDTILKHKEKIKH
jgi:transcriptional regulator with XRE-family HTH domain